jgi:hypothetical protein
LTPDAKKNGFMDDPHLSPFVVGMVNRVVVNFLDGGLGKMMSGDSPPTIHHESIWDDRMLRRAFEVFGGVPTLELADATGSLPDSVMQLMRSSTNRPS